MASTQLIGLLALRDQLIICAAGLELAGLAQAPRTSVGPSAAYSAYSAYSFQAGAAIETDFI